MYALNENRSNIFFCGIQGGYTEQNRSRNVRTKSDELMANARLIAAAPELLENLIGCMEALASHVPDCIEVQCARAAIAKAQGEKSDG